MAKKKIVYLFGAGASHAVVHALNSSMGLMTNNIREVIETKYQTRNKFDQKVWNALVDERHDIEHLISYLEYKYDYNSSNMVRRYYRNAIINLSKKVSNSPHKSNLYSVLLDMHYNINNIDEELQCFMSLNYEDILEKTISKYYHKNINYGFNKSSQDNNEVRVYKLHGSFNWANERPVTIANKMSDVPAEKALWIPPGVDKKKENYPFNLLWGEAVEELLTCDILRVIGCSLSRNDWGLIPILYDIQNFNNNDKSFSIEIIDFKSVSDKIKQTYQYLNVTGLDENEEILNYISSTYNVTDEKEIGILLNDYNNISPMKMWLEAKIEALLNSPAYDNGNNNGVAYNFYHK